MRRAAMRNMASRRRVWWGHLKIREEAEAKTEEEEMKWTEEDIEILTDNYLEYGPQWCADVLDRTCGAVQAKASRLALSVHQRYWTKEDTDILVTNYMVKGAEWCAKVLKRTCPAIYHKAEKLNLGETKQSVSWSEEEVTFIQDNYPDKGVSFCANSLNRSYSSVAGKAQKSGIITSISRGNPDIPTFFYLIDILCEPDLYKVGITSNISSRMNKFGTNVRILKTIEYPNRREAFEKEQEMLKILNKYLENTGILTAGNTETFRMGPQELDILW